MNIFIIIVATVIIGSLVCAIAFLCLTKPRQKKKIVLTPKAVLIPKVVLTPNQQENELIRAGRDCFTCKYSLKQHEREGSSRVECFLQPESDYRSHSQYDWCFQYQPKV